MIAPFLNYYVCTCDGPVNLAPYRSYMALHYLPGILLRGRPLHPLTWDELPGKLLHRISRIGFATVWLPSWTYLQAGWMRMRSLNCLCDWMYCPALCSWLPIPLWSHSSAFGSWNRPSRTTFSRTSRTSVVKLAMFLSLMSIATTLALGEHLMWPQYLNTV